MFCHLSMNNFLQPSRVAGSCSPPRRPTLEAAARSRVAAEHLNRTFSTPSPYGWTLTYFPSLQTIWILAAWCLGGRAAGCSSSSTLYSFKAEYFFREDLCFDRDGSGVEVFVDSYFKECTYTFTSSTLITAVPSTSLPSFLTPCRLFLFLHVNLNLHLQLCL